MEKFNLLDFIARLGDAFLTGGAVKRGNEANPKEEVRPADKPASNKPFGAAEQKNDEKSSSPTAKAPSTSEKAMVEMLRRHDEKATAVRKNAPLTHE